MPLFETEGNEGTVPPEQIVRLEPKLNTGAIFVPTVTLKLAATAH